MSKRLRRNHTASFKAKVALAAIKGRRRSPNWHAVRRRGWGVGQDKSEAAAPWVDLKRLHAKIGELTLVF